MTRTELIAHLKEHDKESDAAGGQRFGDWGYDTMWTDAELIYAHKGDHEEGVAIEGGGRFFYTHTHEKEITNG